MLSHHRSGRCYDVTNSDGNSCVIAPSDDVSDGNHFSPQVLQQFMLNPTLSMAHHDKKPVDVLEPSSSDEAVNLTTKYNTKNGIEYGAINLSTKTYQHQERLVANSVSPNSNESTLRFPQASQWHLPQGTGTSDFGHGIDIKRPKYTEKCFDLNRNDTESVDHNIARSQLPIPTETNQNSCRMSFSPGYNTVTGDAGVSAYIQDTIHPGLDQNRLNTATSHGTKNSDTAKILDTSFHRHVHTTSSFVDKQAYDLWVQTYGVDLVYITKIHDLSFVTIRRDAQILLPFDCIHDAYKYDLAPLLWKSVMTLLPAEFEVLKNISPCVRAPCAVLYDHVIAALGRSGWLLIDTILVPFLRRHGNICLVPMEIIKKLRFRYNCKEMGSIACEAIEVEFLNNMLTSYYGNDFAERIIRPRDRLVPLMVLRQYHRCLFNEELLVRPVDLHTFNLRAHCERVKRTHPHPIQPANQLNSGVDSNVFRNINCFPVHTNPERSRSPGSSTPASHESLSTPPVLLPVSKQQLPPVIPETMPQLPNLALQNAVNVTTKSGSSKRKSDLSDRRLNSQGVLTNTDMQASQHAKEVLGKQDNESGNTGQVYTSKAHTSESREPIQNMHELLASDQDEATLNQHSQFLNIEPREIIPEVKRDVNIWPGTSRGWLMIGGKCVPYLENCDTRYVPLTVVEALFSPRFKFSPLQSCGKWRAKIFNQMLCEYFSNSVCNKPIHYLNKIISVELLCEEYRYFCGKDLCVLKMDKPEVKRFCSDNNGDSSTGNDNSASQKLETLTGKDLLSRLRSSKSECVLGSKGWLHINDTKIVPYITRFGYSLVPLSLLKGELTRKQRVELIRVLCSTSEALVFKEMMTRTSWQESIKQRNYLVSVSKVLEGIDSNGGHVIIKPVVNETGYTENEPQRTNPLMTSEMGKTPVNIDANLKTGDHHNKSDCNIPSAKEMERLWDRLTPAVSPERRNDEISTVVNSTELSRRTELCTGGGNSSMFPVPVSPGPLPGSSKCAPILHTPSPFSSELNQFPLESMAFQPLPSSRDCGNHSQFETSSAPVSDGQNKYTGRTDMDRSAVIGPFAPSIHGNDQTDRNPLQQLHNVASATYPNRIPLQPLSSATYPDTNPLQQFRSATYPDTNPLQQFSNATFPDTNPLQQLSSATFPDTNPLQQLDSATYPDTNPLQQLGSATFPDTNPLQHFTSATYPDTNPLQQLTSATYPDTNPLHQLTSATYPDANPLHQLTSATYPDTNPLHQLTSATFPDTNILRQLNNVVDSTTKGKGKRITDALLKCLDLRRNRNKSVDKRDRNKSSKEASEKCETSGACKTISSKCLIDNLITELLKTDSDEKDTSTELATDSTPTNKEPDGDNVASKGQRAHSSADIAQSNVLKNAHIMSTDTTLLSGVASSVMDTTKTLDRPMADFAAEAIREYIQILESDEAQSDLNSASTMNSMDTAEPWSFDTFNQFLQSNCVFPSSRRSEQSCDMSHAVSANQNMFPLPTEVLYNPADDFTDIATTSVDTSDSDVKKRVRKAGVKRKRKSTVSGGATCKVKRRRFYKCSASDAIPQLSDDEKQAVKKFRSKHPDVDLSKRLKVSLRDMCVLNQNDDGPVQPIEIKPVDEEQKPVSYSDDIATTMTNKKRKMTPQEFFRISLKGAPGVVHMAEKKRRKVTAKRAVTKPKPRGRPPKPKNAQLTFTAQPQETQSQDHDSKPDINNPLPQDPDRDIKLDHVQQVIDSVAGGKNEGNNLHEGTKARGKDDRDHLQHVIDAVARGLKEEKAESNTGSQIDTPQESVIMCSDGDQVPERYAENPEKYTENLMDELYTNSPMSNNDDVMSTHTQEEVDSGEVTGPISEEQARHAVTMVTVERSQQNERSAGIGMTSEHNNNLDESRNKIEEPAGITQDNKLTNIDYRASIERVSRLLKQVIGSVVDKASGQPVVTIVTSDKNAKTENGLKPYYIDVAISNSSDECARIYEIIEQSITMETTNTGELLGDEGNGISTESVDMTVNDPDNLEKSGAESPTSTADSKQLNTEKETVPVSNEKENNTPIPHEEGTESLKEVPMEENEAQCPDAKTRAYPESVTMGASDALNTNKGEKSIAEIAVVETSDVQNTGAEYEQCPDTETRVHPELVTMVTSDAPGTNKGKKSKGEITVVETSDVQDSGAEYEQCPDTETRAYPESVTMITGDAPAGTNKGDKSIADIAVEESSDVQDTGAEYEQCSGANTRAYLESVTMAADDASYSSKREKPTGEITVVETRYVENTGAESAQCADAESRAYPESVTRIASDASDSSKGEKYIAEITGFETCDVQDTGAEYEQCPNIETRAYPESISMVTRDAPADTNKREKSTAEIAVVDTSGVQATGAENESSKTKTSEREVSESEYNIAQENSYST